MRVKLSANKPTYLRNGISMILNVNYNEQRLYLEVYKYKNLLAMKPGGHLSYLKTSYIKNYSIWHSLKLIILLQMVMSTLNIKIFVFIEIRDLIVF